VVLNNQPQGGFENRERSTDYAVARDPDDNGYGFGWFGSYGSNRPPAPLRRGTSYYPERRLWGNY
jgi:hypothetical protein